MKTSKSKFIQGLMNVKFLISQNINKGIFEQYDLEQLEYIVHIIDHIILERVPATRDTITGLIDEIITTSVEQTNLDLLNTIRILEDIKNEI